MDIDDASRKTDSTANDGDRILPDLRLSGSRSAWPRLRSPSGSHIPVQFAGTWTADARNAVIAAIRYVEETFHGLLPQDDVRWVVVCDPAAESSGLIGHRSGLSAVFEHTSAMGLAHTIRNHFARRVRPQRG
ncbi:hypothetical protein [Longibacter sp.]|jgi:hypothetical protein|uniref:hypothetical protein n=1 Tax=Longibacter sp. TaxID=2045415 RepID=UPI003EBFADFD